MIALIVILLLLPGALLLLGTMLYLAVFAGKTNEKRNPDRVGADGKVDPS